MPFKLLSFLALILICTAARTQPVDWQKTRHWMIYNYFNFKALSLPFDSIKGYKTVSLDDDYLRGMLAGADTMRGVTKNIMWMGLFTLSYQLDNETRKVEVSQYGGFFYDDKSKRYYQVDKEVQDEWLSYFENLDLSPFNTP